MCKNRTLTAILYAAKVPFSNFFTTLPEYTIHGAFYVHSGYLHYYMVQKNQPDFVQLWQLNPETGESTLLAEDGLSDYPELSFGAHGILVGTSPTTPLYFPAPE